jgi:predicted  nucleic acid-binding Zn-ribbon protein
MATKQKTAPAQQQPIEEKPATPGTVAKIISEKAQLEIDSLQSAITEMLSKSEQLNSERQQIMTEQAGRRDYVVCIRADLAEIQKQHAEALVYASVAQDTPAEQDAIKKVTTLAAQVEREAAHGQRIEVEYAALDSAATSRLTEIDTALLQIATELREKQARLQDVQHVRDVSLRDLGQHTSGSLMQEYQAYQDKIDALKQQITDLQVERAQFLDQAHATLAPWSNLQREVTMLQPYDDATSRVLNAAIAYFSALLTDGRGIQDGMPYSAATGFNPWLRLLAVESDDLWVRNHIKGDTSGLQQKHARLEALLSQYVASQR